MSNQFLKSTLFREVFSRFGTSAVASMIPGVDKIIGMSFGMTDGDGRSGVDTFLKMGTKAACFQREGKICCDKLRFNIHLRTDIRTSEPLCNASRNVIKSGRF